jgi:hypothetical protein
MYNRNIWYGIVIIAFLFTACKKDDSIIPSTSSNVNTPTCAYMSYELSGGSYQQFISFFDLSSPQTKDKKYFKIQLKYVGVKDSFEVVVPPQSINNLATGFPAEITEYPGYGMVNQWTNPQYRLLTSGGNSYYLDTIVRNPQSNYYQFYLNFLSGDLKGEWPQSNFDNYRVPQGINGEVTTHFRTIFYFNKGICYDANSAESSARFKSINSFYTAAPAVYDWQNVDAAIQIQGSGIQCNFYFFDFKNWRYFKWEQFMNNTFSPAQLATTFHGYESLNTFCKWPEGWGKK